MKKMIKYSLLSLGVVLLGLAIIVGLIAATFNPNDYKSLIVKLVQEKKQRTLHIDGDIKLSYWPKIGANLGRVSISEHNGTQEFAAVNGLQVSLAVFPLLSKQLVVDTIYVDGATANIVRHADGTTNFDDLVSKDKEDPSQPIKFDVDGVHVSNSAVSFKDEAAKASYSISKFNLTTGHVALKTPFDLATDFTATASNPKVNANIKLKGNFMADPEAKHFIAKGLDAAVTGDLATLSKAEITLSGDVDAKPDTMELLVDSLKLAVSGNLEGAKLNAELAAPKLVVQKNEVSGKEATISLAQEKGTDTLKAKLTLADIKGSPANVQSSGISAEVSAKQGARTVEGKFASPFSGNLEKLIFDLSKLAGNVEIKDPALPNGGMKGDFALKVHTDVKQEQIASDFNLSIDNTKLNGDVAVASFSKPNIKFNLNADQLDLNKLLGIKPAVTADAKPAASKPADLSALKALLLDGKLNVGSISYDKYRIANLNMAVKADGTQLNVTPLSVKFDESQIKGSLGISRFEKPIYSFNLEIDKLDADKYITKSEAKANEPAKKADPNAPIDLSALKQINANGDLRLGWLKVANIKTSNVHVKLSADSGLVDLSPLSANLYDGAMNGALKVDARSTPSIAFKQNMTNIAIGPLLTDAINNDMLSGKGNLNVDITTQGNTVGAFKKALNGTAGVRLADGAVKGIDIAGTLRGAKDKLNVLKSDSKVEDDNSKKTDFSEMVATFTIKNGVAHNEDLNMKAPLFRITGSGDIDIANETLNYVAKPTIVATLKGQGGGELDSMNGLTVPVKLTGSFAKPSFAVDFAGLATSLAQKKVMDSVTNIKGADTLKSLIGGSLGGNKAKPDAPAASGTAKPAAPASPEDKAKQKLNKLLGL